MFIIPAIDLIDGKCVRLTGGDFDQKKVYDSDPIATANKFKDAGARRIHIIDLDGAKTGNSINRSIIKKIKQETGMIVQTGGGIRKQEDFDELLNAGVDHLIVGTLLIENYKLVTDISRSNRGKLIAGIDVRDNKLQTKGWLSAEQIDIYQLGNDLLQAGFTTAVFTDISKDGKLTGPNVADTTLFAEKTGLKVIVSGGIKDMTDLEIINKNNHPLIEGIIVGKAYYEKRIDITEAISRYDH